VSIDQTVSDFDGVLFHISTPETKTKILISIQIRCFKDLVRYGAEQVLQREYGHYVVAPEPGFDFSVMIDLENLPVDKGKLPWNMRCDVRWSCDYWLTENTQRPVTTW